MPEDSPDIFKSADSNGTGLGLAIARSLVAVQGGEIQARSEIGGGTTITFSLPLLVRCAL